MLEALLFTAQRPLTTRELYDVLHKAEQTDELSLNQFARTSQGEVAAALEELKIGYTQQPRGFQLAEKPGGWQLVSHPQCGHWIRHLFPVPKPARLSAPALETLAIIAYRQPITRADIEVVRGVTVDGVLQSLMERGLVKIGSRAELPGRPLLYETTENFLEHFGLRNLEELPNAGELRSRNQPPSASSAPAQPDPRPSAVAAGPED